MDQVHQVIRIEDEQMKSTPDFGKRFEHDFIKSIASIGDEFIIILDVDNLFNAEELEFINPVIS